MADFTVIADAALDPDAPLTSELAYAWRDNPLAIAEGSIGAPYVQSAWHPYNGDTVGDGLTGSVWSFAVYGAVSAFETPDFVDGFEYRLSVWGLSVSNTSGADIQYQMRRQTGGGLSTAVTLLSVPSSSTITAFNMTLMQPRRVEPTHIMNNVAVPIGSSSAIKNIRLSASTGNFNAGAAFLYRRRVYA